MNAPPETVLFLCIHNAGRSQMAAGFLRECGGGAFRVLSAGSNPADTVNPAAVEAMAEVGIDIGGRKPKKLTEAMVAQCDLVVTMGCGDACPYVPGVRYLDWELDDPAGKPLEEVRRIRDDILGRVEDLIEKERESDHDYPQERAY